MARVKRGVTTHARHKKVLEASKGFVGRSSTNYRIALERLEKSLQYAYRDRRVKKREFRALWIQRINAATREHGVPYSKFIAGIKATGIEMDRKILAAIAYDDPTTFAAIVEQVKAVMQHSPASQHDMEDATVHQLAEDATVAQLAALTDQPGSSPA